MTTSYWYSTNGMSQRRLSLRYLSILDQAFERHARIQLFDDDAFGHNVPAIANPYQGTMTAGDLHYGLYRQPPMWCMSDTSLDTLILMDSDTQFDEALDSLNTHTTKLESGGRHTDGVDKDISRLSNASLEINNDNNNNEGRNLQPRYKYIQKKRILLNQATEDQCVCCRIS